MCFRSPRPQLSVVPFFGLAQPADPGTWHRRSPHDYKRLALNPPSGADPRQCLVSALIKPNSLKLTKSPSPLRVVTRPRVRDRYSRRALGGPGWPFSAPVSQFAKRAMLIPRSVDRLPGHGVQHGAPLAGYLSALGRPPSPLCSPTVPCTCCCCRRPRPASCPGWPPATCAPPWSASWAPSS